MDKQQLLDAVNRENLKALPEEVQELLLPHWVVITASPIQYESIPQLIGFIRTIDHKLASDISNLIVEEAPTPTPAVLSEGREAPPKPQPGFLTDMFNPFRAAQQPASSEEFKKISEENAEIKSLLQEILAKLPAE